MVKTILICVDEADYPTLLKAKQCYNCTWKDLMFHGARELMKNHSQVHKDDRRKKDE